MRRGGATLAFQGAKGGSRPSRRRTPGTRRGRAAGRLGAPLRRGFRACRRPTELNAGTTSLREADRNRLLRRTSAVLPFADVVNLFSNELTGLRARRLA